MGQLSEGCVCRVFLLNGELVEIVLNKKHTVGDLLTYANRQCELPSASWSHFGLAYIDERFGLFNSDVKNTMIKFTDNN